MPTFYRKANTGSVAKSQTLKTAILQIHSKQIWGLAARDSDLLTVKAYCGNLPSGVDGIEFETDIIPMGGGTPKIAKWYVKDHVQDGTAGLVVKNGVEYAFIPIKITKMTYKDHLNVDGGVSCIF